MNITDVWKIMDDPENFVCDMFEYITDKCEGGGNMAALSPQERVFFAVQSLEVEVNNGGFSQYFGNSSGNLCQEIASAFTAIGAHRTAAICQKALGAYGVKISADWDERQEMQDERETDDVLDFLEECDDEFYEYADDLTALSHAYILKHRDHFN